MNTDMKRIIGGLAILVVQSVGAGMGIAGTEPLISNVHVLNYLQHPKSQTLVTV